MPARCDPAGPPPDEKWRNFQPNTSQNFQYIGSFEIKRVCAASEFVKVSSPERREEANHLRLVRRNWLFDLRH